MRPFLSRRVFLGALGALVGFAAPAVAAAGACLLPSRPVDQGAADEAWDYALELARHSRVTTYTYEASSRLVSMTVPEGRPRWTYTDEGNGRFDFDACLDDE